VKVHEVIRLVEADGSQEEKLMRYAVVIEKAKGNYSAYVPDLPRCVAASETVEVVDQESAPPSNSTSKGSKAEDLEVPEPTSIADYVDA
jgi:hypothetical protein